MPEVIERYGEEYMYRQLAEECAELAQAALKMIRAYHKETPLTPEVASMNLLEEVADVWLMLDAVFSHMLNDDQRAGFHDMYAMKEKRMYSRMLDKETNKNN